MLGAIPRTVWRNKGAAFGIALVGQIPLFISFVLIMALTTLLRPSSTVSTLPTDLQATATEQTNFHLAVFAIGFLVIILMSSIGQVVTLGGTSLLVAGSAVGTQMTFRQVWSQLRPRIGALCGIGAVIAALATVGILVFSVAYLGFIFALWSFNERWLLLIPPALLLGLALVWLVVRLCVSPAAATLEGASALTALRRSWQLTRRNWWRTFGSILVVSVILQFALSLLTTPIMFVVFFIIAAGVGFSSIASGSPAEAPSTMGPGQFAVVGFIFVLLLLTTAISFAVQGVTLGLNYVNLRMRKENLGPVLDRHAQRVKAAGRDDGPSPWAFPTPNLSRSQDWSGSAPGSAPPPAPPQ